MGFKETFSESNQFVKPLRQIENPSFSEDFTYDLQVLMDENTLNEYFAKIYEGHVPMLSMTQQLKSFLPKSGLLQKGADIALKALMSVKVWSAWFPDLGNEFKPTKILDLQCGMSKQSLRGVLKDQRITQVQFHAGNQIEWSANFMCGLFVFKGVLPPNDASYRKSQRAEESDEDFEDSGDSSSSEQSDSPLGSSWEPYRMFYFSSTGDATLDFTDHKTQQLSLYQAKFKQLNLDFSELLVMSKGQRIESEESQLMENIDTFKQILAQKGLSGAMGNLGSLLKMPISPYKEIEQCLGLTGKEAYAEIAEGYMIKGYNYGVKQATASECLFNLN